MVSQMGTELPTPEAPFSVPSLYPKLTADHSDKDHLRQLVLASELPHIPESELMRLATAATDMDGIEEVPLREQHQFCCLSLSQEALDERWQQVTTLDPSDSDGLGGRFTYKYLAFKCSVDKESSIEFSLSYSGIHFLKHCII
jgi:hypothetical protein